MLDDVIFLVFHKLPLDIGLCGWILFTDGSDIDPILGSGTRVIRRAVVPFR